MTPSWQLAPGRPPSGASALPPPGPARACSRACAHVRARTLPAGFFARNSGVLLVTPIVNGGSSSSTPVSAATASTLPLRDVAPHSFCGQARGWRARACSGAGERRRRLGCERSRVPGKCERGMPATKRAGAASRSLFAEAAVVRAHQRSRHRRRRSMRLVRLLLLQRRAPAHYEPRRRSPRAASSTALPVTAAERSRESGLAATNSRAPTAAARRPPHALRRQPGGVCVSMRPLACGCCSRVLAARLNSARHSRQHALPGCAADPALPTRVKRPAAACKATASAAAPPVAQTGEDALLVRRRCA